MTKLNKERVKIITPKKSKNNSLKQYQV